MNKNLQKLALQRKALALYQSLETLNREGHSYHIFKIADGISIEAFKEQLEVIDQDLNISINPDRTLYIKW